MPQNVVEYFVEAALRCRTAAAGGGVRQDKLVELREFQLRRNRLPALISSHSGAPENCTLPDALAPAENPGPGRLTANFDRLQKSATGGTTSTVSARSGSGQAFRDAAANRCATASLPLSHQPTKELTYPLNHAICCKSALGLDRMNAFTPAWQHKRSTR